jgi:hypothetical protein
MDKILITNNIKLAKYAQDSGVERIMVDLEFMGKEERQGHLNTVFSKHALKDVEKIRTVLAKSKLLVRINPINKNSQEEIDKSIELGADIIMLPMFKTTDEVQKFISFVNGRVTTNLLLETSQALVRIDDILQIAGIDEIHIGLNDLHLSMGLDFMFELLSGGIIEYLSNKVIAKNIKFGFGGVARLGRGTVDASLILSEHYRLKSSIIILSRDFKNYKESYEDIIENIDLKKEMDKINKYMFNISSESLKTLSNNALLLKKQIRNVVTDGFTS